MRSRSVEPNGHDYYLSEESGPNTSSLSEPEIHGLLAERLQAKMCRNFDIADNIQNDLITAGVFVQDGLKEWRADGVPFGDMNGGRTSGSRSDRNRDYAKSIHSPPIVGGIEEKLIDALVNERQKCKLMRAYEKADAIREGLRGKYNILIDDRLREWSVGGDFGEEHNAQREMASALSNRGYLMSASSLPLSPENEAYVTERVEERSVAKKNRDFDTADSIRDELSAQFDIAIQDKLKQWSVGGDFGPDGPSPKSRGVYVRRGGGELTEEEVDTINKLIMERYHAKKDRDYDTADDIRDHLRNTYNIQLDDKSSEWHVDSAEFVQVSDPGTAEVSQYDIDIIAAKIAERHVYKVNRDYESADAIRDELNEKFGVQLDDRTKEWRCVLFAGEGDSSADNLDGEMDGFFDKSEPVEE